MADEYLSSKYGGKHKDYLKSKYGNASTSDYAEKVGRMNESDLKALAESGFLDDFLKYRDPTLWEKIKQGGSNVLDVLSRGAYSAGAAYDTMAETGDLGQAAGNVAKELLSGIGGIKGQKKTVSDVRRERSPEYAQFSKDHPVLATISDLGTDIVTDPTTFVPASWLAKGGGAVGKGIGKVATKLTPKPIRDMVGTTFDVSYRWKKANAGKGADIMWAEKTRASGLRHSFSKRLNPIVDTVAEFNPEQSKAYIKLMYGDIPIEQAEILGIDKNVIDTVLKSKKELKVMGRYENAVKTATGNKTTELLDNYLPNNPKAYTDLMEASGDYLPRGYGQGLINYKRAFENQKKLTTGDDLLSFLQGAGVKDENLSEVIVRNLIGRTNQSVGRVKQIRIHNRLINELPKTFRKVEGSRLKAWSKDKKGANLLEPNETLWMPSGNLRFFPTEVINANKDIMDAIETGNGLILTPDMLKKFVGVTSNVPAYAVPVPIAEDITRMSHNLANDNKMMAWWDEALKYWKGFATFSPAFHVRNMISSMSQNYIGDVSPLKVGDALAVLTSKDRTQKVAGKTVGYWNKLFTEHGINQGGLVGQEITDVTLPGAKQLFAASRYLGGHIENVNRAAMFMDEMAKTDDPLKAALKVKKFHFDYSDLTDIEKNVFKRIAPFYAWARNNIPLQLEMVLKAPKKYRNIALLKNAVQGEAQTENNPDWWRNQDVWTTRFGGGTGVAVGLPYADLNMLAGQSNLVGNTGVAGTLYNLASNRDPFMQKDIQTFKGERVPMIAGKYGNVPPKVKYAIENLMPISKRYGTDLTKDIMDWMSGDKPEAKYRTLGKLIGVKIIPQIESTQQRQAIYKLYNDLKDYTKYMAQQEERGKM